MSLPTQDDLNYVLDNRPADELYPKVKHIIEEADVSEQAQREKIIKLVLNDLIEDLSLSNALDDIGVILEYLAQQRQISTPTFDGEPLMRGLGRISKLKLSLDYAKIIGLKDDDFNAVRKAEVDRLWGDTSSSLLKKLILANQQQNTKNKTYDTESVTGVKPATGVKSAKE